MNGPISNSLAIVVSALLLSSIKMTNAHAALRTMGSNQMEFADVEPIFVEPSFDSNDVNSNEDAQSSEYDKIETEVDFVEHCLDSLMLPDRKRHFISQIEFSRFLADMCDILDGNDVAVNDLNCPVPLFETLDPSIQYVFARGICEGTENPDPWDCIQALLEPGVDFGFSVTKKSRVATEAMIFDLCCSLLYFVRIPGLENSGELMQFWLCTLESMLEFLPHFHTQLISFDCWSSILVYH